MTGIFLRRLGILAAALSLMCLQPALASEGGKKKSSPYVSMGTLTATLFDQMRPRGVVLVEVNLALKNPDDNEKVTALLPLLHDRYMQILTRLASNTFSVNRPINLPYLTTSLQQVTDQVVGGGIAAVQITSAMTQGR